MLHPSFFTWQSMGINPVDAPDSTPSTSAEVRIHLRGDHPIYAGHFPGNPVVPGVCQIRMITETLSALLEKEVTLREADPVKFLAMIDPRQHPTLTLQLAWKEETSGLIRVTAGLHDEDTQFLKYKALYSTSLP